MKVMDNPRDVADNRLGYAAYVKLSVDERRRMNRAVQADNRMRAIDGRPLIGSQSDFIRAAIASYCADVEERKDVQASVPIEGGAE